VTDYRSSRRQLSLDRNFTIERGAVDYCLVSNITGKSVARIPEDYIKSTADFTEYEVVCMIFEMGIGMYNIGLTIGAEDAQKSMRLALGLEE